jgi:hypothetical protein
MRRRLSKKLVLSNPSIPVIDDEVRHVRGAVSQHSARKERIGGSGIDNDEVEPAGLLHRIGGSSVNFSAVELTPGRHPG